LHVKLHGTHILGNMCRESLSVSHVPLTREYLHVSHVTHERSMLQCVAVCCSVLQCNIVAVLH